MKKRIIVTAAAALTMLSLAAGCGGSEIGENKAKRDCTAGCRRIRVRHFQIPFSKDRDDGMTNL